MPVYLRKEPAPDPRLRKAGKLIDPMCYDVVAYDDPEATKVRRRWQWTMANKPDRRNKHLSFPEGDKVIVWLPDLPLE